MRAGHPWRQGHVPAIRTLPRHTKASPSNPSSPSLIPPSIPIVPPLLWLDFELASSRGHRCLAVVEASTGLSGVREHILEVRRALPRPFRALERGGELRSRRSLRLLRPAVAVSPSPPPLRSTPTLPERANGLAVSNSSGSLLPHLDSVAVCRPRAHPSSRRVYAYAYWRKRVRELLLLNRRLLLRCTAAEARPPWPRLCLPLLAGHRPRPRSAPLLLLAMRCCSYRYSALLATAVAALLLRLLLLTAAATAFLVLLPLLAMAAVACASCVLAMASTAKARVCRCQWPTQLVGLISLG